MTPEPMQFLWDEIAKEFPNGTKLIVYRDIHDLEFLYATGFVDTDRYTLKEWTDAFQDSRKKDGSYHLTHPQWMAKTKYRYNGPVSQPFDPMALAEGELSPDEFEILFKEKILPSTTVAEGEFRQAMEKTKSTSFKNGKFQVTRLFKIQLSEVLEKTPSPRRLRELAVAQARSDSLKATSSGTKAVPQGTKYSSGPTPEKRTMEQFSRLLGKNPK